MTKASFDSLRSGLRLPLVAAPMFLVSGPDLVVAACAAGVIGSFPTANCRTVDELDLWLQQITERLAAAGEAQTCPVAPYSPNLIVHKSNTRLAEDLKVLLRHRPKIVITSVGPPTPVLTPLHDVGALVFSDVATAYHAEKAVAAGADGLVLLTAGAGGQTGWLNPFAFVRDVRSFFDGPIVLAGGISNGHSLYVAEVLGCDMGYMGTRFIATHESMASDAYKKMLIESRADDILLTKAFTGLPANMLKPSIVKAGLDPDNLSERGAINVSKDINPDARKSDSKRWKDIWSAGHSVSGVEAIMTVRDLVAETSAEYEAVKTREIERLQTGLKRGPQGTDP
ncbi:MAG: nitronate monooxygenase [Sneathiella sp.]|nr:nitronate monooxygenase [Sneathiella sp.]